MDLQRSRTSPQLPEEIIEAILVRAPVKTVARFRCVSQQWRSFIGTKRFITQHLRNSQRTPSFIFNLNLRLEWMKQCNLDSIFCELIVKCLLNNRGADGFFGFDFGFARRVFGCIDGMVCFLDRSGFVSFCNPSTRVTTTVLPRIGHRIHTPGFGFVESTGECKVFVVVGPSRELMYNRNAFMSNPDSFFERKVYSSKLNSWKSLGNGMLSRTTTGGVLVNEKLHWAREIGEKQDIVFFDIRTEVFGEIELPLSLKGRPKGCLPLTLGVFGGSLSWLYGTSEAQVEIWVMEKYGVKESWTQVVNLQPPFSLSSPFCTGPMGEIVFVYGSAFLAYYPAGNVFRLLGHDKCFRGVYNYVESLVSPDYAQDAAE